MVESANLDAEIQGILRVEVEIQKSKLFRLRCFVVAKPNAPDAELKMKADEHSYGAEWWSVEHLKQLKQGDKDILEYIFTSDRRTKQSEEGVTRNLTHEKLRNNDLIDFFEWAETGTKAFDLKLYRGIDAPSIDVVENVVQTEFAVQMIVKNLSTNLYYVQVKSMQTPVGFQDLAIEIYKKFYKVLSKKPRRGLIALFSRSTQEGPGAEFRGISAIYHQGPKSKEANGYFCVSYYIEINVSENEPQNNLNEFTWLEPSKFAAENSGSVIGVDEVSIMAVENIEKGILAPLNFLAWEGSSFIKLE